MADLVRDKVVQRPFAHDGTSTWRDQAVVLDYGVAEKNIFGHRIRRHTGDPIIFVEEEHLPPARVADEDVIVLAGEIERRTGQFGSGKFQHLPARDFRKLTVGGEDQVIGPHTIRKERLRSAHQNGIRRKQRHADQSDSGQNQQAAETTGYVERRAEDAQI